MWSNQWNPFPAKCIFTQKKLLFSPSNTCITLLTHLIPLIQQFKHKSKIISAVAIYKSIEYNTKMLTTKWNNSSKHRWVQFAAETYQGDLPHYYSKQAEEKEEDQYKVLNYWTSGESWILTMSAGSYFFLKPASVGSDILKKIFPRFITRKHKGM